MSSGGWREGTAACRSQKIVFRLFLLPCPRGGTARRFFFRTRGKDSWEILTGHGGRGPVRCSLSLSRPVHHGGEMRCAGEVFDLVGGSRGAAPGRDFSNPGGHQRRVNHWPPLVSPTKHRIVARNQRVANGWQALPWRTHERAPTACKLAAGLRCTACLLMLNAYQTWQGYDSMLCHAQGAKQDAQLRRLERAFAMDHVDVFHVSLVRIFPPLVLRVPRQQQSSLAHLILKAIGLGQIIYQHLFLLERTLVYPIISRKLTIISRSPGSHTRTRSQRYSAVRARVIPSFTTSLEH
jgi:hypothetical protein